MGISSNQARFLALTSREIDLEFRIQQICQRRMRLSTELEDIATSYNNTISNRQLYSYSSNNNGIGNLGIQTNSDGATQVINTSTGEVLKDSNGNPYILVGVAQSGTTCVAGSSVEGDLSTAITWTAGTGFKFVGGSNIGSWSQNITLQSLGLSSDATESEAMDAAIRSGVFEMASQPDEFTQTTEKVGTSKSDPTLGRISEDLEIKDWRTIPVLADELYNADDEDAENKYDKATTEINAQDKKLQLEQTSIEVEYKEVTSEKDAVKKILDTNSQASFKYFS